MVSEVLFLEYFSSLLEGDKKKCMAVVAHLLEQDIDLKDLYKNLFQKSLYLVGKMWENNKICVATEHVATSITESLITFANIPVKTEAAKKYRVVVSCVPKEFHQVGAKMVANIFEYNGWETYFVGANAPIHELLKLLKEKKPHLLAVSITFYINLLKLIDLINQAREVSPNLPIIVGGQALADNRSEILNKFKKVTYIGSLAELEKFACNFKPATKTKSKLK